MSFLLSRPPASGRLLGALAFVVLALAAARADSVASVAGSYESEGTVVQADSGYNGPVSLRALLALDFDLAQGSLRHPSIAKVDVRQDLSTLAIRTRKAGGELEWSAEWKRNGGFEATKDGVKLLFRGKQNRDDVYMFTLTTVNDGGALTVKIEKIEASKFGPVGRNVGTFLFLRVEGR
jgi:hypothetical protein